MQNQKIKQKIAQFKRKYYQRQLVIGVLLFVVANIVFFLTLNGFEYFLWLSSALRALLFFAFFAFTFFSLWFLVGIPLSKLIKLKQGLSDSEAAKEISSYFPKMKDQLINALQLMKMSDSDDALLLASIDQKEKDLNSFQFVNAVDYRSVRVYGLASFITIGILFLIAYVKPDFIRDSSQRLINYTQHFTPDVPFYFYINQDSLVGFKGEDYTLKILAKGSILPEEVSILLDDQIKLSMYPQDDSTFIYSFPKIQRLKSFKIISGIFESHEYEIKVHERPDLQFMQISILPPKYTNIPSRQLTNSADLLVEEGSKITWKLLTNAADDVILKMEKEEIQASLSDEYYYTSKAIFDPTPYEIVLENEYSRNTSSLSYQIEVIKDQFPTIEVNYFPDSISYQYATLSGLLSDDYGIKFLQLVYYKNQNKEGSSNNILDFNTQTKNQSFFHVWDLDSLQLTSGDELTFYLRVSDNDGVNGSKTTNSEIFKLNIPDKKRVDELMSDQTEKIEKQLDGSKNETEDLANQLRVLDERMLLQQKFDWREQKMVENILNKRNEINQQLSQLQEQSQNLQQLQKQFENSSEPMQEKFEQLQEQINELMDEETMELYEQLKEMLKQNQSEEQIREKIQELQKKEQNLEKELERTLELFKRLKMESLIEKSAANLDSLSKQQNKLAKENTLEQKEEQKRIKEGFEDVRKDLKEAKELNQDLKKPTALTDHKMEEMLIEKDLKEIEEMMEEMSGDEQEKQEEESKKADSSNKESSKDQEKDSKTNQADKEKKDALAKENNSKEEESESSDEAEKEEDSSKKGVSKAPTMRKQNSQKMKKAQQEAADEMKKLSQKMEQMQEGMQMETMMANLDQLRDILDNLIKISFNQEYLIQSMRGVSQADPRFLTLSQEQLKLKDDFKVLEDSLTALASQVVQLSTFVTREAININSQIDKAVKFLKDRQPNRSIASQQFSMTGMNNLALLLDDVMSNMQMSMSEAMGQGKGKPKDGGKSSKQGMSDFQEMQKKLGQKIQDLQKSGKSGRALSEELAQLAAEQEMIRRALQPMQDKLNGRPDGNQNGDNLGKVLKKMEENEIDLVNKQITRQLIERQQDILTKMLEVDKSQRQQETENKREARQPSGYLKHIPKDLKEYIENKKNEIDLLKSIPSELNPFYKKELNDYYRRISKKKTL